MAKTTKKEMLAALREALAERWVSAFQEREDRYGSEHAFVVDHHDEDGDERRSQITLEGFINGRNHAIPPGDPDPNQLANALNRHADIVRAFADPDDSTPWGNLATPDEDDE